MDKEILEQFQMLAGMMEKMQAVMLTKDDIEPLTDRSASKAAALVEEKLGKRIDALTDGYKLTHEKQWELERKMEQLTDTVENLQTRLQVLEDKTA